MIFIFHFLCILCICACLHFCVFFFYYFLLFRCELSRAVWHVFVILVACLGVCAVCRRNTGCGQVRVSKRERGSVWSCCRSRWLDSCADLKLFSLLHNFIFRRSAVDLGELL